MLTEEQVAQYHEDGYNAAYEGGEFPRHQDNGYEAAEPPLTLSVVIAVDDVTVENGCLWVLPGSHEGKAPLLVGGEPAPEVTQSWL